MALPCDRPKTSAASSASIAASGTCQLSWIQSSHEPRAAAAATGFLTTGFGAGVGGELASGGGSAEAAALRRRCAVVAGGDCAVAWGARGRGRSRGGALRRGLPARRVCSAAASSRVADVDQPLRSASWPSRSLTRSRSACIAAGGGIGRPWRGRGTAAAGARGHEAQMSAADCARGLARRPSGDELRPSPRSDSERRCRPRPARAVRLPGAGR